MEEKEMKTLTTLIAALAVLMMASTAMAQADTDNRCTKTADGKFMDCTVRSGSYVDLALDPDVEVRNIVLVPPSTSAWYKQFRFAPALSTWSTSNDWSVGAALSLEWLATPSLFMKLRLMIGTSGNKPGHPDLSTGGSLGVGYELANGFRFGLNGLALFYPATGEYPRERSDERFLGGTGFVGFHYKGFYAEAEAGAGVRFREMPDTVSHASTWTMAFTLGYLF